MLNALRAHDDRFDAIVKKIELRRSGSDEGEGGDGGGEGGGDGGGKDGGESETIQLFLPFTMKEWENVIYARLVQKVGDRQYLERWAADVAIIAQNYIERITRLVEQAGPHREAFNAFLTDLRRNINPSVTAAEVVEMLAQHVITKPVFEALFENYSFVQGNPVSRSLQGMLDLLEQQALDKDTAHMSRFYESVKSRAKVFEGAADRQKAILELYDKFFRTAFPRTVEKLGIVYTPVEIVDFINRSADWVLREEFGRGLADKNVHILDPFTGTGTFIVRLIQSGLIPKQWLADKYSRELHANEIVLLAYYIACINIENAYHDRMGAGTEFVPFPGICLTDTFQIGEDEDDQDKLAFMLTQNSERVQAQREAPIRVIIGNPPYSVGQKSEDDNAKNQRYPKLEGRIATTYVKESNATQSKSLYDSYIKAFRWATDRLKDGGGVITFVTNGYWLDSNAMDGFRKCLQREFSKIYVFNLRGNQRTSGETSRKEGGKIFGVGSRAPIAITVLVKKSDEDTPARIFYHDIGDYLSREEKLQIVAEKGDIGNMDWTDIQPNEHGDWLNPRNDAFATFLPLGDKERTSNGKSFFEPIYSMGVVTNRDAWCYNASASKLTDNIQRTISFYNNSVNERANGVADPKVSPKFISWTRALKKRFENRIPIEYNRQRIYVSAYRPFGKLHLYFDRALNEMVYQAPKLFPTCEHQNRLICVTATGGRRADFSPFMVANVPDLHLHSDGTQCFPLYYYEEQETESSPSNKPKPQSLFETQKPENDWLFKKQETKHARKDGITDFILNECRLQYGGAVTKEDIFHYVYGLLHSPEYRETFAADLKKMLPRLPLLDRADDFWAFTDAGRALAALHLDYETQPPCPDVTVTGAERGDFTVRKMRFVKKGDKSAIQYNPHIRLTNIPLAAYDYVVNGRSAIEWIMERYQVKTDRASGITNDPNDWAREHDQPRYILDLLLSIVTVSLETMRIVRALPKLDFGG